ncbi:hypothetical protein JZO73_15450, partial [Enterococcus plantarum]|nr:hypothetical protein [Enterococcus plantarum]
KLKVIKRVAYGYRNFYHFVHVFILFKVLLFHNNKGSILSDVGEQSPTSFLMQNTRKDTLISFRIKSTKTNQKGKSRCPIQILSKIP